MSSSQSQMVSVKEVPKKISAKEKFAAAQAAKMAAKATGEAEKAAKEAKEVAEKAKHEKVFAKEKKKVAKELATRDAFEEEFTTYVLTLTKEQRVTKLADVRREMAEFNRSCRDARLMTNAESAVVGKDAQKLSNMLVMTGILTKHI